jgi:hypothetical protein
VHRRAALLLAAIVLPSPATSIFYLPGVAPNSYEKGENVRSRVWGCWPGSGYGGMILSVALEEK